MDDQHNLHEKTDNADANKATTHVMGLIGRLFRDIHQSATPAGVLDPEQDGSSPKVDLGNADTLRQLAAGAAERREKKDEANLERRALNDKRRVKELLETHLANEMWDELMSHVQPAAERGDIEFQLLQFPSDLCTDGGRKIRISEEGWQDTLRGEAAELAARWKRDLEPKGFGLGAWMVDYSNGMPGDIGLFLTWRG